MCTLQATERFCVQWAVALSQNNYSAAISLNTESSMFDTLEEPTILIKLFLSTIDVNIINVTRSSAQQVVSSLSSRIKLIK